MTSFSASQSIEDIVPNITPRITKKYRTRQQRHQRRTIQTSQSALRTIHGTKRHLHRLSHDTPSNQPLPHLRQSRTSRDLAPISPLCILGSTPQNLRGRTCSRPHLSVQIDGIRLFRPDMYLAAKDEMSQVRWDIRQWVVGIHQAPVLAWRAVVRVGVVCLARFAGVKV